MGNYDYIDGIVYLNGLFQYIVTEEGRAVLPDTTKNVFRYTYDFKDYLGNVRATYDKGPTNLPRLVEEDEYYAFGLNRQRYNFTNNNRYLYNGKKEQNILTDQYDYGARFYDPVIARFTVPDRFSEKYLDMSTYQYGALNPIPILT